MQRLTCLHLALRFADRRYAASVCCAVCNLDSLMLLPGCSLSADVAESLYFALLRKYSEGILLLEAALVLQHPHQLSWPPVMRS